ncbi:MAG TPA: aldo/keto reductase [Acidimicrobiales bacterium]|nr:aldo/keto reductase [Acidimicrobiales bacterium]
MEYRTLGRTGVKVSSLCLGAMMFGSWGNPDHDECLRIIQRALDEGINFIDTADVYSEGESEQIIGEALTALGSARRDEIVLATKVHGQMGNGLNRKGNSRRWVISECEATLRRLATDHIDLYQIHRPEPDTDIEETLSALSDLVHAGKIRYFGSSTFPAWMIVEAQWTSERRLLKRFSTEQPPYSILARGVEADVLPVCQRYGVGVLSWSPLTGGWLSGRFGTGKDNTSRRASRLPERYDLENPTNQAKLTAVDALSELAEKAGHSLPEIAIAFVLSHPAITSAIIGPRTMNHLSGVLGAGEIHLGPDLLDRIDEIVPPGQDLNQADSGWVPPWVSDTSLRRRARR